ncbi:PP2C family protein-serine/threonine phosphatase [Streptomyces sp. CNQ085]|uniref:PP2C family protein-serine/threonine phosphatase n=1 Tax=Streptomyces sp. CNQ085 TaxID=2886944 RepID=UPI001F506CB9|nr:PP2C family protein-serine/threonine phosphatase [Streptomyces sp. CNQ085]MCI0384792.1 SpoIIE family protein phosphatase [Streptomyces sp. CNQ085]
MGVCDAIDDAGPHRGQPPMSAQQSPKLAGIESSSPFPQHTVPPAAAAPHRQPAPSPRHPAADEPDLARPVERLAAVQDRLAGWISDLTTLHDLTERLVRTDTLESAVHEALRAGAALVGARRGLIALEPADGLGPDTTVGLGLGAADLGHIETLPRDPASHARLLGGLPDAGAEAGGGAGGTGPDGLPEITHPHIARDEDLDPRHREVAARLGYAASHAVPLSARNTGRLGAAVWLYDEPARPTGRQRHLLGLYVRHAAEHIARQVDLARTRSAVAAVREGLLPARLPRVPGVRLAVRHSTGPRGGGDWYDVLPLPGGALGLCVGGVTGSGPDTVAAMGRLRASMRAYAVMEGEDPVAVLSDLELLLRLTEPARSATALFGYAERCPSAVGGPRAGARVVLAGAGHCPPLIVGPERTEAVETALSAPLGMLACWEAPGVEVDLAPGETLLLYSDGLLHRTGEPPDRAFGRLRAAAVAAVPAVRADPDALLDHLLRSVPPVERDGAGRAAGDREDVVLLAARF